MTATYRINQELKYLYFKKQKLDEQLYQLHLHCAHQWSYTWRYIQHIVNNQLHTMTENLYQTMNKKLKSLRVSVYKNTQHQLRHNKDTNQPLQFQFYSKIQESDGYPSFPGRKRNTGIRNLTFMGPCIVNVLFKYNQQMQCYAIFFITVIALHVSDGFSAHRQDLKNCTHSIGYMSNLLAASTSVGELEQLTHASKWKS